MEKTDGFLQKALQQAIDEPFFNMFEPGSRVGKHAKDVLLSLQNTKDNDFTEYISKIIYPLVKFKCVKQEDKEHILTKFYAECMNESNLQAWSKFLTGRSISYSDKFASESLFQFVMDKFLQQALSLRTTTMFPEKEESDVEPVLEMVEEQTLRYVAGYIIFSLKKKMKNSHSTVGSTLFTLLSCWGCKEDNEKRDCSLNDYTKDWIEKINRGGLLHVSDDFYNFIVLLEKIAKRNLNGEFLVKYCGQDIRKILLEKMEKNATIQSLWDSITRKIENKNLTDILKVKVLQRWMNIRIYAFVNCWVLIMRRKASRNATHKRDSLKKGQPSLRKSLGEPGLNN